MYRVNDDAIHSYSNINGWNVPDAADIVCSNCRSRGTFRLDNWIWDHEVRGKPKRTTCPKCREQTVFIWLDAPQAGTNGTGRLYVDAEQPERQPLPGLDLVSESEFSGGLRRAYMSALNVLNIGEPEAGAAAIRRVLEGIVKHLVPTEKQSEPLARLIAKLSDAVDFNQPFSALATAIKDGGNLAAHFDEEQATTSMDDAFSMLRLLELVIDYVFVMPKRVEKFRASLTDRHTDSVNEESLLSS